MRLWQRPAVRCEIRAFHLARHRADTTRAMHPAFGLHPIDAPELPVRGARGAGGGAEDDSGGPLREKATVHGACY
jgi:hypothetical protein